MRHRELLKKPVLWLSLMVISAIIVVYYWLGGFNPLQVEVVAVHDYTLMGKEFEGTYHSDTIQMYFSEMKSYLSSGTFQGPIVIIFDEEPQGKKGRVKNFVGIQLPDAPEAIPSGMTLRKIPAKEALQASKACHSALMPNPDKIDGIFQRFTDNESFTAYEFNIEMYYPNNRLVIHKPLKPDKP